MGRARNGVAGALVYDVDPMLTERALPTHVQSLEGKLAFASVGQFPTRVQALSEVVPDLGNRAAELAFIKREDLSSTVYGGNKVRTLEVFFGEALRVGQTRIFATGAYGSNHALATVLHAPRLGLRGGAMLFPQPVSGAALENFRLSLEIADPLLPLAHWSALPLAWLRLKRELGSQALIMAPGGATPLGALGYVSAALELAEQIRLRTSPSPRRIVLGIGSGCTTAGLLVGVRLARVLGLAFTDYLPEIVAVRVTPWPVTSVVRVAYLAQRCSELLARLSGKPNFAMPFAELCAGLTIDGRFLGRGYGQPTASGRSAMSSFSGSDCVLDTTYSAKAVAGLFTSIQECSVPTLFWATKSSAALPKASLRDTSQFPPQVNDWLRRAGAAPK